MIKRVLGIGAIDIAEILRDLLIEDDPADGALDELALLNAVKGLGNANENWSVQSDLTLTVRHDRLVGVAVYQQRLIGRSLAALSSSLRLSCKEVVCIDDLFLGKVGVSRIHYEYILSALFSLAHALHGQVVGAEDHILSRNGYGVSVLRTQEVICREHEYSRFSLSLCG